MDEPEGRIDAFKGMFRGNRAAENLLDAEFTARKSLFHFQFEFDRTRGMQRDRPARLDSEPRAQLAKNGSLASTR